MSYVSVGQAEEAIPQTGADDACTAAGGAYNPVTGQCVMGGPSPQQLCQNVGMNWVNGVCVDPLAGKTKPGTAPLEPGGPGTPGWGAGGGSAAKPVVTEATAKAAMPWLIGAAVGVGVLALIATAASKKKPAGHTAHAVANRIMRSF